jgi:hypothetical protein
MSFEIDRRGLIRIGAGAVFAAPLLFADTPKFFTEAEFAMLDELTEIIIPADGHSPGARAAQVAAYIDARLAEAFEQKDRDEWRSGLHLVNNLSGGLHGHTFMEATAPQRLAVVQHIAKNEQKPKTPDQVFFGNLKHATVHAYYTSKIGIHNEMEYKGNVMLEQFAGYEVK